MSEKNTVADDPRLFWRWFVFWLVVCFGGWLAFLWAIGVL